MLRLDTDYGGLEVLERGGGRQTIGGNRHSDVQRNSRLGGTFVFPFARRHAIKIGYSKGWVTSYGSNYGQFLVSHTMAFR